MRTAMKRSKASARHLVRENLRVQAAKLASAIFSFRKSQGREDTSFPFNSSPYFVGRPIYVAGKLVRV